MNVNYGAIQRLRNKELYTLPYSYKVRRIYIESTLRTVAACGVVFYRQTDLFGLFLVVSILLFESLSHHPAPRLYILISEE